MHRGSGRPDGLRRARARDARAHRAALPRPASSAAARCARRSARSRAGRRRDPSTSFVVSAYASRKIGSPKFAHCSPKPPTNPFTPAMPTLVPLTGKIVCDRSRTTTPASASARDRSPGRSDCQSWLPSTATTGIVEIAAGIRHDAHLVDLATLGQVAGEEDQVGLLLDTANASRTRSRSAAPAWMSPAAATRIGLRHARRSYPDSRSHARVPTLRCRATDLQRPARRDEARRRHAARPRDRVRARGRPGRLRARRHGERPRRRLRAASRRRRARAARCSTKRDSAASARPRTGSTRSIDSNDSMIDLIFAPNSHPEIVDELLDRADELEVYAIALKVMSVTDVLATQAARAEGARGRLRERARGDARAAASRSTGTFCAQRTDGNPLREGVLHARRGARARAGRLGGLHRGDLAPLGEAAQRLRLRAGAHARA